MSRNPIMIDLFSGAGGLSEGLRQANFESIYANEIKSQYLKTYAHNHKNTEVDPRDIRLITPSVIRKSLEIQKGELDLIAGGPPCQGFSINAPYRSPLDQRNHLFRNFLNFVEEFHPKSVLIENVPGLVSFENGATLQAILDSLKELGYQADVSILYAPHFGVPQTRWRTIIIAFRNISEKLTFFPDPHHDAPLRVNFTSKFGGRNIVSMPNRTDLRDFVSVQDAIDDLPVLKNGEIGLEKKSYRMLPQNQYQHILRADSEYVTNHEAGKLSTVNLERLKYIPPGGNWTNIPFELLPKGMQRARKSDHTKRYGRVMPDGLASTILTKCDPHWGAYFHYNQDRTFTVREAARIQSFPDSFHFLGSKVEQYEQVGNAVPPLLAQAIGNNIFNILEATKSVSKVG
jgi:DNA (cytosine-5)-methyltransferase 1